MKDTILVTPVQVKRAATKAEATEAMKVLRGFVCREQLAAITSAMRGEERQFFFDKAVELAVLITNMPATYATDGQGLDAVVHLHYFKNGFDWFITEKDMLEDQHQAFGLADMGDPELGYISIIELLANRVELDLYWTPKAIKDIKLGGRQ
jgi:hypothetical protein